jgi:DNA-binding winged helix-turn-helix (wHTH) protein/TolB-like protein
MDGILPDRSALAYRSGMERVRFGIYDFSPSTGELRRDGTVVRLQAQPARVLAALVRRPGEIVSRDTLQREVWGEETHVDFERGLNFCVAQVRSALRDSADLPRYIETVPKQGYRFIAPIHTGAKTQAPDAETSTKATHNEGASTTVSGGSWRGAVVAAALTLVVVLAAGVTWTLGPPTPPAVVVVPFYNETGRPELDPLARAIGDATVAHLAAPGRTSALNVIGNAPALRNPFARQDVQRIALDLDAQWVVIGQLKADGAGLRVIAHLIRAADMKHAWAETFDDETFSLPAQSRAAESIATTVESTLAAPPAFAR